LIFDSTRRNAEATAKRLSTVTMKFINPNENEDIAKKILEENEGEMSRNLADCIRLGSAFHHAGLLNSQRKIVEDAFRDGRIKVVVSTPTLSAGVNLPARRVIIKSYYRFEGYGSVPIKVMEYKQMAGRAGRPGMDPRGEAILVVRNKSEKSSVFERYIFGRPEDIESKLGAETHLRFHTLSLISEEFARTMDELIEFFSDTFFFYQNQVSPVFEIERVVGQLEKWGFIENESGVLLPTSTGSLVSKLYIDPLSGFIFIDCLKRFDDLSEIATLHLICRTPDMEKLYLKKSDDWVEDEAFSVRDELTYYPSGYSIDYDWFLREFKTALCIQEWINEEDEDTICEKFGISPGDLRRIIESAEWLSYSLRRIAENMNYHSNTLKNLDFRIKYGIKGELIDLVGIKGVGRVRARKLYNAGIKSYDDILSNEEKISTILGKKIAENIINEVQRVAGR
jgi:helicase